MVVVDLMVDGGWWLVWSVRDYLIRVDCGDGYGDCDCDCARVRVGYSKRGVSATNKALVPWTRCAACTPSRAQKPNQNAKTKSKPPTPPAQAEHHSTLRRPHPPIIQNPALHPYHHRRRPPSIRHPPPSHRQPYNHHTVITQSPPITPPPSPPTCSSSSENARPMHDRGPTVNGMNAPLSA